MKRIFFLTVFVVPFIISCEKNSNSSPTPAVPKVKRLMFFRGHINNIDFDYDNQSRVISIKAYFGNSPINVPPSDSIFNMKFEYNGNNFLPSKFTYIDNHRLTSFTHFITYDNNNRPIRDSSSPYNTIQAFEYHSNFFYKSIIFHQVAPSIGLIRILNENYVSAETFPNPIFKMEHEYDNAVNPLNHLNIAPIALLFNPSIQINFEPWSIFSFTGKNNITKFTFVNGNPDHLSYIYNSTGLPDIRYWYNIHPNTIDTIDAIKYIYE